MKILLLMVIALLSPTFLVAQDTTPKVVYKGEKLVAVYNLFPDSSSCASEKFVGMVTKVSGEYPDMNVTIKTKTSTEVIGFNTGELSMADNGNLYYWILKKGARIEIGAYMCGSGGFLWADSFKVLPPVSKKK